MDQYADLLKKRDAKAKPHLNQYAPVWLSDQVIIPEEEAVMFQAIFRHNRYGWVTRRYRYDGFNDVLYHKGQQVLGEDEVVDLTEGEPYINTTVNDTVNAYGG